MPPAFSTMKKIFLLAVLACIAVCSFAQKANVIFAHISDTHIGGSTAAEDLRRTVQEINANDSIQFVILTGDITEFGADEEIRLAKQILDSLNKKWYIIPGNHDSNWSESGANTFKEVFGAETFFFQAEGYTFLGTHSGPNMRMSPGQIPRENIVWLDSILRTLPDDAPVIFANHYPMDSSLNNWYEATDLLKKKNIQLLICGHGHTNKQFNFEGIPAIMGRPNLRAAEETGGYNIVRIENSIAVYTTHSTNTSMYRTWATVPLEKLREANTNYYRPGYEVNDQYGHITLKWVFRDDSDIGSGASADNKNIYITNTAGYGIALNKTNGRPVWRFQTKGKIYSTPAVSSGVVVIASSDQHIYGLSARDGKELWRLKAGKAVLGSPVIDDNIVYIGASDGIFRAIDVKTGNLHWETPGIQGFVVTTPFLYHNKIYFGSWGREFYCLDKSSGKLLWKWDNGHGNRMFSPAACYPVAVNNRVFIVAPDRFMTVLDAVTGKVIWRKSPSGIRVRESMGISADSSLIYVKTMDGNVYGVSTTADSMHIAWKSEVMLGYEISPTAIVESNQLVFVPTQSGTVAALHRKSGAVAWKHKVSNALVTGILPVSKREVLVSTMDGKVSLLHIR